MMLKDKTIIITGCSRGIGAAMLQAACDNGATVFACVRKPAEEFSNTILNKNVTPLYFDLTNQEEIKAAIKTIVSSKLKIDGLINNAGITYNALTQMTTDNKLRELFEINFFSQFLFMQSIAKLMIKNKKGSIVNISSTAALDANPGRGAYGASKAALLCMSRVMAKELAEHNVRVNVIAPGITNTDMVEASMSDDVIKDVISHTNLNRIGQPIEIANTAMFLLSDLSSYITGEVFRVDGGLKN